MRITRRNRALALAVLLVSLLVFSSLCMAFAARHACCGKSCPICDLLARAGQVLRVLALLVPLLAVLFAPMVPRLFFRPGPVRCRSPRGTLVSLKIRLND